MKDHQKVCPEREYYCKIDACKFQSKKEDFLKHLIGSHANILLQVSENFSLVKEVLPSLANEIVIEMNNKKNKIKYLSIYRKRQFR